MKYQHRFRVQSDQQSVADFHTRSASLAGITPPPLSVRFQQAPERLAEGDEMRFTLKLGPLSIPWQARLENVSSSGFIDRQLSGPFQQWIHRHSFHPLDAGAVEVIDDIEASLRPHLFWGPVGLGMWLGLPFLFAYRARKTRQALEGRV